MKYSHIEAVLFDLGGVRKAVAAQPNNGEIRVHLGIPIAWRQQDHAGLFFQPLREIIAWQLDDASPLAGEVRPMKVTSAASGRESVAEAPLVRFLSWKL